MNAAKPAVDPKLGRAAWLRAEFDVDDVYALQGLARGDATPQQQKDALRFVIERVCETYGFSFRPGGPEGERETCLAEGKRVVGLQLVHIINLPPRVVGEMKRRKENGQRPTSSTTE